MPELITSVLLRPLRKVENGKVTDKIIYLTADEEDQYKIAQINIKIDDNHKITQEGIPCRYPRCISDCFSGRGRFYRCLYRSDGQYFC